MRKILLDIGACTGQTVSFFRSTCPNADQFEIYCFEPLKENLKALNRVPGINVIGAAAWDSDGVIPFYSGRSNKGGSVYCDKLTGGISCDRETEVIAVDIASFIKRHFSPLDEIWFKMNAEGAEHVVVPHLFFNDLLSWFECIYVSWHFGKIPSMDQFEDDLRRMLPHTMSMTKGLALQVNGKGEKINYIQ
jgi:FkbM family methyltransferase